MIQAAQLEVAPIELAPIPAARVSEALADALAEVGRAEEQGLLARFLGWLAERFDAPELGALGDVLVGVLAVGAGLALALAARRAWRALRAPAAEEQAELERAAASARARVLELAEAAQAARARGDLRLALRLTFHALLLALGGRGDLELDPAWTNRELLRRGRVRGAARALLEPLVLELEPKEFGRAPVSEDDVARLSALLAPHLERGEAAA